MPAIAVLALEKGNRGKESDMRIVFLMAVFFAAFQQVFAAGQTVAVLPSDGVLSQDELEFLTDKAQEIAVRVLPKSGFEVFPQEVVIKRLGGADSYVKECKEISCIVELGRKASVDYVAQCRFGKLGSDLRITFELYNVKTSGLIDKFSETEKDRNGLLAIMEKRIPDGFMKIPGAAPEAKTAPPPVTNGSSGEMFTDSRDGKKYRTVKIGRQTWMAENLNYNAKGSKCYDNKPANCEKYGRLYDWNTAMKACPSGWHLPSGDEYEVLDNTVGGENVAGKKLKSSSGWKDNGNGTDEYGFSALPGGGNSGGKFIGVGNIGVWWSASEGDSDSAYGWDMLHDFDGTNWIDYFKSEFFSVRCVQNLPGAAPVGGEVSGKMFTDSRDGKKYRTVKIGTQTWMAENLNYDARGSKCYENNSGNCARYGRLYDWNTAMKSCPSGWHLPSQAEWRVLDKFKGESTVATGTYLKARSGWNRSGNGTDEYGFSALPGGLGDSDGRFEDVGNYGVWWTASEATFEYAYNQSMSYLKSYMNSSYPSKANLFSVRCIQD